MKLFSRNVKTVLIVHLSYYFMLELDVVYEV